MSILSMTLEVDCLSREGSSPRHAAFDPLGSEVAAGHLSPKGHRVGTKCSLPSLELLRTRLEALL